jgi:subtilisin family serine protease
MTCRFLDSSGQGSISDAVACIDYARAMGAQVINASWVTTEASTALELAVASAREAGIVFVAGAGNDGQDNDQVAYYPPNLPLDNVLAVAATDAQDRLWNRSNYGATTVDLAAPGVNIHSTFFIADNNYVAMTGSSQAAAFVSGAAALVRAAYPTATHQEVIDRLLYGTDPVPGLRHRCRTGGRLNLRAALDPAPTVVWPQTPVVSAGNRGGPFAPDAQAFVILNRGSTPLDWTANVTASWLHLESATGTVSAGGKQTVTVALSPTAATLPPGEYVDRVAFVLQAGASQLEVPWTLAIYEPATVRLRSAGPAGSGLELGLTGQPGATYVAESSTNFSAWCPLLTNALPASGDTPSFWSAPATHPQLYFRARVWQPN